jgi:hypothetical protein
MWFEFVTGNAPIGDTAVWWAVHQRLLRCSPFGNEQGSPLVSREAVRLVPRIMVDQCLIASAGDGRCGKVV